jgi:hypothetical protein
MIDTPYHHPGRAEYTQRLEELPVLEPHHQAYFTPDFAAIEMDHWVFPWKVVSPRQFLKKQIPACVGRRKPIE